MAANDCAARVVVCDAGPLIHLDELGCVNLLDDFHEVVIPPAVWREVSMHRPEALARPNIPFLRVAPNAMASAELESLSRTFPLHEGEREALQVACEIHADLLLSDDTAARLAAKTLGVSVHGTIGMLFRAIRTGRKSGSEIAALLRSVPTMTTLHLKMELLDEFVQRAEQSK